MTLSPAERRVIARALTAYVEADIAWRRAARRARLYFPCSERPQNPPIGDAGSPMRRLHEARERALLRLMAIRAETRGLRKPRRRQVRLLIRS